MVRVHSTPTAEMKHSANWFLLFIFVSPLKDYLVAVTYPVVLGRYASGQSKPTVNRFRLVRGFESHPVNFRAVAAGKTSVLIVTHVQPLCCHSSIGRAALLSILSESRFQVRIRAAASRAANGTESVSYRVTLTYPLYIVQKKRNGSGAWHPIRRVVPCGHRCIVQLVERTGSKDCKNGGSNPPAPVTKEKEKKRDF